MVALETELTKRVIERLSELIDEETSRKFGELNIVIDVQEIGDGAINVKFQPLSPYSPIAVNTGRKIKMAVLSIDGVKKVNVECRGHMLDELVNKLVNKEDNESK